MPAFKHYLTVLALTGLFVISLGAIARLSLGTHADFAQHLILLAVGVFGFFAALEQRGQRKRYNSGFQSENYAAFGPVMVRYSLLMSAALFALIPHAGQIVSMLFLFPIAASFVKSGKYARDPTRWRGNFAFLSVGAGITAGSTALTWHPYEDFKAGIVAIVFVLVGWFVGVIIDSWKSAEPRPA